MTAIPTATAKRRPKEKERAMAMVMAMASGLCSQLFRIEHLLEAAQIERLLQAAPLLLPMQRWTNARACTAGCTRRHTVGIGHPHICLAAPSRRSTTRTKPCLAGERKSGRLHCSMQQSRGWPACPESAVTVGQVSHRSRTRGGMGGASKACLSRLQKEYQRLGKEPVPNVVAEPK